MSLVLCLSHKCEPGFMLMLMSRLSSHAYKVPYAYVYTYACVASEDGALKTGARAFVTKSYN